MKCRGRLRICLAVAAVLLLVAWSARPARAYIGGPPATLGMMCLWSTHVTITKIERVDRDKNVIFFRKVQDVKGRWPAEVIKHVFPPGNPTFVARKR